MKTKIILLTLASVLFSCSPGRINIVKDSKSGYEIVISSDSDSIVMHSATELQYYLEKISGINIPVITADDQTEANHGIFIGTTPGNELSNTHTVFYKVEGENLIIGGGSSKSVLYSVYSFLENELGCMWLSPDAEIIPGSDKVSIRADLDYEYTPEIEIRTVHSKLFYENHDFADKLKVTYEAFPGYVSEARVHTFHRFMPASSFYGEYPEYYALRDGKRLTTQLCLTNPDVLEIVIDSVAAYFKRHPESGTVSVSQHDNTLHCQCDDCKAIDEEEGSASGTMIRFVNQVAEQFPDKTISTLAYQYTRKPCKTRPADNVLVTLCSIECDRSKPIEQDCIDFTSDLRGWKELTDNIRIWDYTTQFTNFLAPFPNIHTLGPNIRFFRDNNARWIFEQHSNNPSELFELRSYLTAKLLWIPDSNSDDIIHEFCKAYYKEAGEYIEDYITAIHEEIVKIPDFFLFLYGDPSQGFDSFLSPEMLNYYNNLFRLAREAVAGKPEIIDRVNISGLSILFASLEASRANLNKQYSLNSKAQNWLNKFEKICKDAGIEYMNEMGYTVDEYISSYKKTLERFALPNLAAGKKVDALTSPKKYAGVDPMVLTDGALGGPSFYSNWLGFEGNDMEVIIDLGEVQEIKNVQTAFLQVTNHIVFFPEYVEVSFPGDISWDAQLGRPNADGLKILTSSPLKPGSKVNDIEYFNFNFDPVKTRYVKIYARNIKKAPDWHHASGLPAWIFCDEIGIS